PLCPTKPGSAQSRQQIGGGNSLIPNEAFLRKIAPETLHFGFQRKHGQGTLCRNPPSTRCRGHETGELLLLQGARVQPKATARIRNRELQIFSWKSVQSSMRKPS